MRRLWAGLGSVAILVGSALLAQSPRSVKTPFEWAGAGQADERWAVLLELGTADQEPTDWSGALTVEGASLGETTLYRQMPKQRLTANDAWQAGSHQPPRWSNRFGPKPTFTAGPVLDLSSRQGAVVHLTTPVGKTDVPLVGVTTGAGVPIYGGKGRARIVSRTVPLASGATEDDFPAAAYGPDGALHVAYISYAPTEPQRRARYDAISEEPDNFAAYKAPAGGDQLWLRTFSAGKWSDPVAVTSKGLDLCRCAVACSTDGTVWVGYASNVSDNFDIYARPYRDGAFGAEQRLSTDPGPDLDPALVTDSTGAIAVAWQAFRDGVARIDLRRLHEGEWTPATTVSEGSGNAWNAALAAAPDGRLAIAWDQYIDGDYDALLRERAPDGSLGPVRTIAATAKFEARPTLAFDSAGRLWVGYEEGPEKWGQDYGPLDAEDGKGLYHGHAVRVCCLVDGQWRRPVGRLPDAEPNEENRRLDGPQYSYPRIAIDLTGAPWLVYRQVFGRRVSTPVGSYWQSMARRLDGERWSEPIEVLLSEGLLDSRPAVLPTAGDGIRVVHNTDHRMQSAKRIGNDLYASTLRLPGKATPPVLEAHEPELKDPSASAGRQAQVKAIRDYRIDQEGKTYRLLRGEFHRHTDISWDGRPDGTVGDMFRYAIDAAALDWIGNGDHDNGVGREYTWWLTQKQTDAYHTGPGFTPMFTYERSVSYPNGHRNAMFAYRGVRTLPRLTRKIRNRNVVHPRDTKMFYRYLHELDGICASHTSATGMGTDWRDSDPEVEPIVEIYQGDRQNYETPGAPRSPTEQFSLGGYRPKGFIDAALRQGIKLGFQSSSDHWSTHISYCIAVAEGTGRKAILDALKQRHCYAATDNIIVDVRVGTYLMGDAFESAAAPELTIHVRGTGDLARVVILRDSQAVHAYEPTGAALDATWRDPKPQAGEHYYYIRVEQRDEELAWSSPIWIKR